MAVQQDVARPALAARLPTLERTVLLILLGVSVGVVTASISAVCHFWWRQVPDTAWLNMWRKYAVHPGFYYGLFLGVTTAFWPRHVWKLALLAVVFYYGRMVYFWVIAERQSPWWDKAYWIGNKALFIVPCALLFAWLSTKIDLGLRPEEIAAREAARSRPAPRVRRAHGGFSLVELLVVVAIIAILAGLLFPVFATARRKGYEANCISNLRQIGMATNMYLEEYGAPPWWFHNLHPKQVTASDIFTCPADAWSDSEGGYAVGLMMGALQSMRPNEKVVPDFPFSYCDFGFHQTDWAFMAASDERGILACALHGTQMGQGSPPLFHGKVLRLAASGRVFARQAKHPAPKPDGETKMEFWMLYSDEFPPGWQY